jgi:outer membrane protein TolC
MKYRIVAQILFTVLMFCLIGPPSVLAQQRTLSLQEAIELSIKNNKQLKASEARIEQATATVRQAEEARLPDAKVTGSYMRLNSPTVNLKIKQPGSNGGSPDSSGGTAKVSQAMYGMVNLSLPIYTGGRIRYGIESARYLEQASRLDADNDREEVILNTIDAFNNLYKAKSNVTIVDSSLAEARERVREYGRLEQNGLLARNDLLKARLQESNVELSLLDAENNWRQANFNMNIMLGLPDSTEIIPDITAVNAVTETRTVADFLQLALQNRKDLNALDYRKRSAETGVKSTRADMYPSLALTGGYVALNIPNALTVYNAVNIGLGLQYNFASLWKTAKLTQAKARVREMEANREALSDAIRLQINQAYQNYLLSLKRIDVYNSAIAQAEENYKVITNKFNNGLATVTDVLDASVSRVQSQLNLAYSKTDSYVAYNRLLQTAGLINNTINQTKSNQ